MSKMTSTTTIVSIFIVLVALIVSNFVMPELGFQPKQSVRGKHVIVTGASMGIGKEIALLYCQWGAHVVILARTESKLQQVVQQCNDMEETKDDIVRGSIKYLVADLSTTDDSVYAKVISDSVKLLGGTLDTLVLNHYHPSSIVEEPYGWADKRDVSLVRNIMDTNFFSFLSLTFQSLDFLEASKGKIVVVGSATGRVGMQRNAAYCSSKHALFGFFNSLRLDFVNKKNGVSISNCMLGSIATETNLKQRAEVGITAKNHSPKDCARTIVIGGESRLRDIYFPIDQTYLPRLLEAVFPSLLDMIVRSTY